MPSKHGKRAVRISDGKPCPKCGRTMGRYQHHPDWLPRDGRVFYRWWDKCNPCGHVQLYAEAKEEPERKPQLPANDRMRVEAGNSHFRAAGAAMFDGKQWLALDAEGNTIGVCLTRTEAWRLADSCGMIEVQFGGIDGQNPGRGVEADPDGGEQPANPPDNSTA